jgi:O-antigen/teichoic acid export membrane protein
MVFYGVYYIFTIGVGVRRKTWFVSLAMTLAALINVGCNLVLIPLYGSMGAALSTLIAYVFLALIMYVVNQRVYPIPFEINIFAMALLVGIAMYAGSSFLAQHQTIYGVCAIDVGSTVLYGGCLVLLGKVSTSDRKSMPQRIKGLIRL